jgi:hypothetical protein
MSTLIEDNEELQKKFFDDIDTNYEYLLFRETLSSEEQHEGLQALLTKNAEEYVDSRVDKIVIALGDLYHIGIDIELAWRKVFEANMSKTRGIKPGREGSGGKDIMKPDGWKPPSHKLNHGVLDEIF